MLQRISHPPTGVVFYRSPLLMERGIPHAFSTRLGGVSAGLFVSLNLGNPSEQTENDAPENIEENYRRLQEAALSIASAPGNQMPRAWVKQVHGNRVELLDAETEGEYAETFDAVLRDRFQGQMQADALLSEMPGVWLSVRVADCAPILLAAANGQAVAAVHAGWRGVVAGVLPRAIRALGEIGVAPQDLVAAIGPCIGVKHFEVGAEVAEAFARAQLAEAVEHTGYAKPHVNLVRALSLQLARAGVTRVDSALATTRDETKNGSEEPESANQLCTFANAEDFFSHRREHGRTGRMAALIARRPA